MDYSLDEFEAVIDDVKAQGGERLDEPCVAKDVVFTKPPYKKKRVDKRFSCGCNNHSRVVVEYNDEHGHAVLATACLVCDGIGAWPRFMQSYTDAGGDL